MTSLSKSAALLRKRTVEASYGVPHHLGGCLSCIEILTALFHSALRRYPDGKDMFVLSKGHAAIAYYQVLADVGEIDASVFEQSNRSDSPLLGHPCSELLPAVPFSTGSLGMGVSFSVGAACGVKLRGDPERVFVLTGDGELQAGVVWEALLLAGHRKLSNFTLIVDNNLLQTDCATSEIAPVIAALKAFGNAAGFDVIECDGHDVELLAYTFSQVAEQPRIVVANTIKGKGVPFMEGCVSWHSGNLDHTDFQNAISALSIVE